MSVKTVLDKGKIRNIYDDVTPDFTIPSFADFFDTSSNLVPQVSGVHPGRMLLADKAIVQAISLKNRQAPLVQPADGNDYSFNEKFGKSFLSATSPVDGVVTKVSDDEVEIKGKDNKKHTVGLANYFPMGRKSFIHNTLKVEKGQTVKKDSVLATSNFTDEEGNVALGTNVTTAIMPYRASAFEDAYVLTEAGAKKLVAEQLMKIRVEKKFGVEVDRSRFVGMFPTKYTSSQFANIATSGVVKKGTKLGYGDPIVLALVPKSLKSTDIQLGNLSRTLKKAYKDVSEIWEYESEGEVVDVSDTGSVIQVTVRTERPMQVGDKLSSLGFKGVVSRILPESETPTLPDGRPVDLILNTMSITSRVAPAVASLISAGKVAEKQGRPVRLPSFTDKSLVEEAEKMLKENDLTDVEELYDPVIGKKVKALTGPFYINRLTHIGEDKLSVSSGDSGMTFDQQPSKTNDASPKRMGNLGTTTLLSHNAFEVLKDVSVRSSKNDEYWRRLKLGLPLPKVEAPFIFNKFVSSLQGAGVKVDRQGETFNFLPQTSKDVEKLSTGEIVEPTTFKLDNKNTLLPEKGGLFDPVKTGIFGDRYNHISLAIKVPNPISEEPIRKLMGMTEAQYKAAIRDGSLEKKLQTVDLDKKIAELKKDIPNQKGTKRDNSVKVLSFLNNLKKNNIHPSELMLDKIPVIPAQFRPIVAQGDLVLSSDVNNLYKDLMLVNNSLKNIPTIKKGFDFGTIEDESKDALYDTVKAIYGLGAPVARKSKDKNLKGLLGSFLGIGSTAKTSKFQANVVNKPVDLVTRAVLKPSTNNNIDEVELPQDQVLSMYSPFVMRRLVQRGVPATQSAKYVKDGHPLALQELEKELKDRPVLVTRDPQWHKFNQLAFYVKPNADPKDSTIGLHPLVFKGFGADNDGDTLNAHVPSTEEAKEEAKRKMLPSVNLLNVKTFEPILIPTNEAALGINLANNNIPNKKPVKKFNSVDEMEKAFFSGEVDIDDPVEIS